MTIIFVRFNIVSKKKNKTKIGTIKNSIHFNFPIKVSNYFKRARKQFSRRYLRIKFKIKKINMIHVLRKV